MGMYPLLSVCCQVVIAADAFPSGRDVDPDPAGSEIICMFGSGFEFGPGSKLNVSSNQHPHSTELLHRY
jgi:hypothetical protein